MNNLISFLDFFKDDSACEEYYFKLRFKNNISCVYCKHTQIYICESQTSKQLYKCAKCKKKFNVFVNTFFENTKISIKKWFTCIFLMQRSSKGLSSVQMSKQIGVSQKTAWTMMQKIRNSFNNNDLSFFSTTEIDETYIGGKEKNKHQSKRTKNTQGRSLKTKIPVLGMINREENKQVKAFSIKNVQSKTIQSYIENNIEKGTEVYTDEFRNYNILNKVYKHSFIKHREKEYVRGSIHTNNIENFWSIFKRGYLGIYHWMSEKHLQKYLDEYTHRFNYKHNWLEGFNILLLKSKRITYQGIINDN